MDIKVSLDVSSNNKKELIEIISYEKDQKGFLFWTKNGTENEYELVKIEKSKECINFWLKFNHFNVKASLLIESQKVIINVGGNRHEFEASVKEIKKLNNFKDSINVPLVLKCFNKIDNTNSIIESELDSISSYSRTNRCKRPRNYRIIFKTGAITELENVCLFIKSTYGKPDEYEFYENKTGIDNKVSIIFDHNLVDAIFIVN